MSLTRLTRIGVALAVAAMAGLVTLAVAQDTEEQEARSAFVGFVERIISTPDRQIRLGTIHGVLSSDVRFSEITIADREGVWLRIEDVHLIWSRRALLGGRLEIESLEADAIVMERRPAPPEEEIPEEAQLRIPELPVAMNIERLAVPYIAFGENVFGLGSELSAEGRLRLAGGDLDTELAIERLDGPGGHLNVTADYDSGEQHLALDFALSEPEDGVVANLLDLQGRPALDFSVSGAGPLEDFAADIGLLADGEELLSGTSRITRVANGFRFLADIDGRLGELAPPQFGDLFGNRSSLVIDGTRSDDGAVSVHRAEVVSGVMSLSATAQLAPDGFPVSFDLDARLGTETDDLVVLPFGDGITVRSGRIQAEVGEADADRWSARFEFHELDAGTIGAEHALVTADGVARNRDVPEERELTFELSGAAEGLSSDDEALAEALGQTLQLTASGAWAHGSPVDIDVARIVADHVTTDFTGNILDNEVEGEFQLSAQDIAPFSGIAGQDLGGAVDFGATGTLGLAGDSFDVTLDGTARNIEIGTLEDLLEGETRLTGRVARSDDVLQFDALQLLHENVQASVAGQYGAEDVNLNIESELADVSLLTDRASGAARLDATLTGTAEVPTVEAALTGADLVLMGRPFTGAEIRFSGPVDGGDIAGDLTLSGNLDGVAVQGETRILGRDGLYAFEDLVLTAGETSAAGNLTLRPEGLLEGALSFDSPDLSVIAPLVLSEMSGSATAEVELSASDGEQHADVQASLRAFRFENIAVASADLDVQGQNLFVAPRLAGDIQATAIEIGAVEIVTLSASAEQVGGRTEFEARVELDQGIVTTTGRLVPDNGGLDVEFDTFDLQDAAIDATLAEPVVIELRDGTVTIPSARLRVGGGSVVVSGRIGDTVDVQGEIDSLNLAVANTFAPDLGLAGVVSGTVAATGPTSEPRGSFSARVSGLSVAAIREAGIGPLALETQGSLADGSVDLTATARGSGMTLDVDGTVALAGSALQLSVAGSVPLGLADTMLAEQEASLAGTLRIDATIAGSLADPRFAGSLATDGATFVHVGSGLSLSNIGMRARLTQDRLVIETLTGSAAAGGTLSVSGNVGIAPGSGFPAELTATLTEFRYEDGRLITAIVDGNLSLTGSLVAEPLLSGTITIQRAEITVPEGMPAGAAMLDVTHYGASQSVLETVHRAHADETRSRDGPGGLRLDLTIDAPRRIFVRGRGIDAEFGGRITLTGPASDIRPVGAFDLRRGHLALLAQRVSFTRGTISLVGDLDPMLDFVATTSTRQITVTASVTGRATRPNIELSSMPELPQDEVLAQFLFGRSLDNLSALQLAQLAAAAATLAGGSGDVGLLGNLRQSLGVDELDLVAGEDGGAAIQAGRYISENIYLGVRTGTHEADSGATINLDVTDDITARGELGADGRSKLGVFFEREY